MTPELETHEDKWSEISRTNPTRLIYGKRYRIETPAGGEKLLETMEEVEEYLERYYDEP